MTVIEGLDIDYDIRQGYNFNKTDSKSCGFMTKLKIGDKELPADQMVKNILDPEKELAVVAVMGNIKWGTGITDPLLFEMQVSPTNKTNVKLLLLKELVKIDVTFEFLCYDFDTALNQQQYFESFHSNKTQMKGVLLKDASGGLVLKVKEKAGTEVAQPENFLATLGVEPKGKQVLHYAASVPGKIVKQWGMDVTA